MLFIVTFYFIWDFYSAILLSFLECYQVKQGMSEANCLNFTIGQVLMFIQDKCINKMFIATAAAYLLTATDKWFPLALIGAAFFVQLIYLFVAPKLCTCFEAKVIELEDDDQQKELLAKIDKLTEEKLKLKKYKVSLMEPLGGDLHSGSRLPGAILGSGSVSLDDGGELGAVLDRRLGLGGRTAAGRLEHHGHLVSVDPGLRSRTRLG